MKNRNPFRDALVSFDYIVPERRARFLTNLLDDWYDSSKDGLPVYHAPLTTPEDIAEYLEWDGLDLMPLDYINTRVWLEDCARAWEIASRFMPDDEDEGQLLDVRSFLDQYRHVPEFSDDTEYIWERPEFDMEYDITFVLNGYEEDGVQLPDVTYAVTMSNHQPTNLTVSTDFPA